MSTLKVNNIESFTGANPVTVSDKLEVTGELSGSNSLFASLSLDPETNFHKTVLYDTTDGKFYYTGSYLGPGGTQGIQGVIGAQGQTGVGTQGVTGTQGNDGAQGQTGVGTQGVTGTQGNDGAQGADGSNGSSGTQGVQGVIGTQGTTGTTPTVPFTASVAELRLNARTNATTASISGSGTIYFNSDTNAFYGFNGSNHLKFTTVAV